MGLHLPIRSRGRWRSIGRRQARIAPRYLIGVASGTSCSIFDVRDHSDVRQRRDQLADIPPRIAAATTGVRDPILHRRTVEEPWSVNDVLAHLRAAADHRMRYMRRMATGAHGTLSYVSPRSELKKTDYLDRSFAENLEAFSADRRRLIEWLDTLSADDWERGALIRDRPETVATYARYLVEHELAHCEQIEAILR